jgi:hypothetical protein
MRDKDPAGTLRSAEGLLASRGKIGAELWINDLILFVDAALHFGVVATRRKRDSGGGKERSEDVSGAAHGGFAVEQEPCYGR